MGEAALAKGWDSMGPEDLDDLNRRASELPLSVRSHNCLDRAGIETVGDLTNWTAVRLLKLPNFGRGCLEDVQAALADLGLELAPTPSAVTAPGAVSEPSAAGIAGQRPDAVASLTGWQKGLLTLPIGTLALTPRSHGALEGIGCRTVGDLVMLQNHELLRAKNMGRTSIAEIARELSAHGLHTGLRIADDRRTADARLAEWELEFRAEATRYLTRQLEERIDLAAGGRTDLGSRLGAIPSVFEEDLDPVRRNRNCTILSMRYGWDGSPGCTLEVAGQKSALTRERVRQLEAKFEKRVRNLGVVPAWLTDAIAAMEAIAPCRAEDAAGALREVGITLGNCDVRGVLAAAPLFGMRPDLTVPTSGAMQDVLCTSRQAELGTRALRRARALTSRYGCFTRETLLARLRPESTDAAETRRMFPFIQDHSRIAWLDEGHEWAFVPGTARSRLLGVVRKTLSVADWVGIDEIRSAIRRNRHMEGFAPRRDILLALLKHVPWIEVDGERARGIHLDAHFELLGNDRIFWETLVEAGRVLDRYTLIDRCIRRGMNFTSCHLLLNYSPVVSRVSPFVYALAGTTVSPEQAASMTPAPGRERVMQDYGHDEQGRPWIVARATVATITNGMINLPTALSDELRGNFAIQSMTVTEEEAEDRDDDALEEAPLMARISRGILSGLHPALAERAVEVGDHILILFDPDRRTLALRVGDENVSAEVLG